MTQNTAFNQAEFAKMNEKTLDSKLKSWVNVPQNSDFPIQNLPFGIFKTNSTPRAGVAIGEEILDLSVLEEAGLFKSLDIPLKGVFSQSTLNEFMKLGPSARKQMRFALSGLLNADTATLRDNAELRKKALVKQTDAKMLMPVQVPNYVDFYSSIEHATNVGSMFRDPINPLLPNWKHIPIGYNGRASSVIVSGTNFSRPCGQTKADTDPAPSFGPSKQMDFELEMGVVIGSTTELGQTIPVDSSYDHAFGFVLLNDWSARDIQRWEYVPLGPFLGKTFATSVSPWIVTLEALEPFRIAAPVSDTPVLPYLNQKGLNNFDIQLEIKLKAAGQSEDLTICKTNYKTMYFSAAQQIAHLASNGTNICTGDIYGSGTISGATPDSYGSMLELCWKGTKPIVFADGTKRTFLQDGDTVTMSGFAIKNGVRIGFGSVVGTLLPAKI